MIVDELGRTAAAAARHNASRAVDPVLMLDRLDRMRRRRRTVGTVLGAVLVVAAIATGGALASRGHRAASLEPPATSRTSTPYGVCVDPQFRCLSGGRIRVTELPVPVDLRLPRNFQSELSVGPDGVTAFRNDMAATGVVVTENAVPVRYGPIGWIRDPSAGTTAHSMARWLADRPFLIHTRLTRTTVGALTAWHVSADLKPGAALPAPKAGGNVAPTFGRAYNDSLGYRKNLKGEYTLVDVRGAGVTVIWSWTVNHPDSALIANQTFIDTLSFG